jgi:hypothetical protein
MTILTGNQIEHARVLTLRTMLKLEIQGLKMSRGPTAYSILKKMGYKGSREKVLIELNEWRNNLLGEQA